MICPKCPSQGENGNFCGNCGQQLKEKCSECGKMEPISKVACQERVKMIIEQKEKFVWESMHKRAGWLIARATPDNFAKFGMFYYIFFCVVIIFSGLVRQLALYLKSSGLSEDTAVILAIIGIAFGMFALVLYLGRSLGKKRDKSLKEAEQEFSDAHPDLVEIIQKSKGDTK